MDTISKMPSISSVSKADRKLVEYVFLRMEQRYGEEWRRKFKGLDREKMISAWQIDLSDMSPAEIRAGIEKNKDEKYAPSLPRFREMCRPVTDYESAFIEAATQLPLWEDGLDKWTNPAYYHAARKIGFDFFEYPYQALQNRWKNALDDVMMRIRKGEIENVVPKRPLSIAQAPLPKEKVEENIKRLKALIGGVFKPMK